MSRTDKDQPWRLDENRPTLENRFTAAGWRWYLRRYGHPPAWYCRHVWHAPQRTLLKSQLSKARKEYHGSGEVEVIPSTAQHRHNGRWSYL